MADKTPADAPARVIGSVAKIAKVSPPKNPNNMFCPTRRKSTAPVHKRQTPFHAHVLARQSSHFPSGGGGGVFVRDCNSNVTPVAGKFPAASAELLVTQALVHNEHGKNNINNNVSTNNYNVKSKIPEGNVKRDKIYHSDEIEIIGSEDIDVVEETVRDDSSGNISKDQEKAENHEVTLSKPTPQNEVRDVKGKASPRTTKKQSPTKTKTDQETFPSASKESLTCFQVTKGALDVTSKEPKEQQAAVQENETDGNVEPKLKMHRKLVKVDTNSPGVEFQVENMTKEPAIKKSKNVSKDNRAVPEATPRNLRQQKSRAAKKGGKDTGEILGVEIPDRGHSGSAKSSKSKSTKRNLKKKTDQSKPSSGEESNDKQATNTLGPEKIPEADQIILPEKTSKLDTESKCKSKKYSHKTPTNKKKPAANKSENLTPARVSGRKRKRKEMEVNDHQKSDKAPSIESGLPEVRKSTRLSSSARKLHKKSQEATEKDTTKDTSNPDGGEEISRDDPKESVELNEKPSQVKKSPVKHTCDHCSYSTHSVSHLRVHIRTHTGDRPFKCTKCNKGFIQTSALKVHERIHNNDRPFLCMTCGRGFRTSGHLSDHVRIHTGERPYMCLKCRKTFRISTHLRMHIKIHNNEKHHKCDDCGKSFIQSSQLRVHQKIHNREAEAKHVCTICDKKFLLQWNLNLHTRAVHSHGIKPFKCEHCNRAFSIKNYLSRHLKFCMATDRRTTCPVCSKELSILSMKKHLLTHSDSRKHMCMTCGKRFTFSHSLISHVRVHTKETPHDCPICKMSFSDQSNMRKHYKRIHRSDPWEKSHECALCNNHFYSRVILSRHIKEVHTTKRPYHCRICNKAFKNGRNLKQHEKVHDLSSHVQCNFCPQTFSQKGNLKVHIATVHNKVKNYDCSMCDMIFASKRNVANHMRTHTGEKPFECSHCSKKFTQRGTLKRHERVHTGERPYKCDVCETAYMQKVHLRTHQKRHEAAYCTLCKYQAMNIGEYKAHKALHTAKLTCPRCSCDVTGLQAFRKHLADICTVQQSEVETIIAKLGSETATEDKRKAPRKSKSKQADKLNREKNDSTPNCKAKDPPSSMTGMSKPAKKKRQKQNKKVLLVRTASPMNTSAKRRSARKKWSLTEPVITPDVTEAGKKDFTEKDSTPSEDITVSKDKDSTTSKDIIISPDKDSTPSEDIIVSPDKDSTPSEDIIVSPDKDSTPSEDISISPDKDSTPSEDIIVSPDKDSTPSEDISISPDKDSTPSEDIINSPVISSSKSNLKEKGSLNDKRLEKDPHAEVLVSLSEGIASPVPEDDNCSNLVLAQLTDHEHQPIEQSQTILTQISKRPAKKNAKTSDTSANSGNADEGQNTRVIDEASSANTGSPKHCAPEVLDITPQRTLSLPEDGTVCEISPNKVDGNDQISERNFNSISRRQSTNETADLAASTSACSPKPCEPKVIVIAPEITTTLGETINKLLEEEVDQINQRKVGRMSKQVKPNNQDKKKRTPKTHGKPPQNTNEQTSMKDASAMGTDALTVTASQDDPPPGAPVIHARKQVASPTINCVLSFNERLDQLLEQKMREHDQTKIAMNTSVECGNTRKRLAVMEVNSSSNDAGASKDVCLLTDKPGATQTSQHDRTKSQPNVEGNQTVLKTQVKMGNIPKEDRSKHERQDRFKGTFTTSNWAGVPEGAHSLRPAAIGPDDRAKDFTSNTSSPDIRSAASGRGAYSIDKQISETHSFGPNFQGCTQHERSVTVDLKQEKICSAKVTSKTHPPEEFKAIKISQFGDGTVPRPSGSGFHKTQTSKVLSEDCYEISSPPQADCALDLSFKGKRELFNNNDYPVPKKHKYNF